MIQMNKTIQQKVKEELQNPKHNDITQQIIGKMGRLLAKKRQQQNNKPKCVFDNRIWLGNFYYANDRNFIVENKIQTVISCLDLQLTVKLPTINYKQFALKDQNDSQFQTQLQQFYQFIQQTHNNVYVHCFAGKSRSPAFLIYFIMRKQRIGYSQARQLLSLEYSFVEPNKYFENILRSKQNQYLSKIENLQSINLLEHQQKQITAIEAVRQSLNIQNLIDFEQKNQVQIKIESPQKPVLNLLQQQTHSQSHTVDLLNFDNEITEQKPEINLLQQTEPASTVNNPIQKLDELKVNNEEIIKINEKQLIQIVLTPQSDLIDIKQQKSQLSIQTNDLTQQTMDIVQQTLEIKPATEVIQQKEDQFIEQADFTQKKRKPKHKKKK